jgi:hypothetical protein
MHALIDGKNDPFEVPAAVWHASDPMYDTHFQVCSGALVPAQMLLPFMLLMTDRVPSGDFTTGATPTSSPGSFANVVEESDRDKHHEQRERHRGAVAEVKLPERIVVDVQLHDVRGVRQSPLGGDLDDVEHLERADHREDDDHGEDGAQERNGQPPEHLDLAGTVEPTGLVDLVRDRLEPRHDQDRAPWWGRASFSSGGRVGHQLRPVRAQHPRRLRRARVRLRERV